jgi:hypothetical protein
MAWFRIRFAKNAFLRSLDGAKPDSLSPADGLDAMIAFYRDHRPQHAVDDVLEFVWKSDDLGFELAICRRMQRDDSSDPAHTLELAYRFTSTELQGAVAGGQLGCGDPDDLPRFHDEVTGTAAWKIASTAADVESQSLEER